MFTKAVSVVMILILYSLLLWIQYSKSNTFFLPIKTRVEPRGLIYMPLVTSCFWTPGTGIDSH